MKKLLILKNKLFAKKSKNIVTFISDNGISKFEIDDSTTFQEIVDELSWDACGCSVYNDEFNYKLSDYIPTSCREVYIELKTKNKTILEIGQIVELTDEYKMIVQDKDVSGKIISITKYPDITEPIITLSNGERFNAHWLRVKQRR